MRAGKLDRLITIQRKSVIRSNTGQEIITWITLSTLRPASLSPLSGDERFSGAQIVAKEQFEFIIRWSNDVSDLEADDRIIYPSNDSPSENQIYDVIQVSEIGRREGLRIAAFKRSA